MSASITPTCWPSWSSAAARLTVSDDLPTPPLPLAIAITRVRGSSEIDFSGRPPRSFVVSADFSSGVITPKRSSTRSTPGTLATCSATCSWKELRSGQPATVSAIVTDTAPPSISSSRTMSSLVTGLRSSGSITRSSALRIASRSGVIQEPSGRLLSTAGDQPTSRKTMLSRTGCTPVRVTTSEPRALS